ncbi:MAG: IMPACT family protein [Eubacterium sp.]|jgi:uncharacterized YigZ family protein|nr:IMPACT family protein [Eubacterium sp.]
MEYKTVESRAESRFIVKKSEFIGVVAPAETDEQATDFINGVKADHRKAAHNCYAYILRNNNTARHSDDGEPGGTAGVPIHEVLVKTGIVDAAIVVTRYYGGILLGAAGLARAYSHGAAIAVAAAKVKLMALASRLHIEAAYPLYGLIGGVLNDPGFCVRLESEQFSDKIDIFLYVKESLSAELSARLIDVTNGSVVIQKTGERFFDFS